MAAESAVKSEYITLQELGKIFLLLIFLLCLYSAVDHRWNYNPVLLYSFQIFSKLKGVRLFDANQELRKVALLQLTTGGGG